MLKDKVKISSRGLTLTEANTKYMFDKLDHLKKFDKYIKHIEIEVNDNKNESNKLTYIVNITAPHDVIRIEEKGNDLYSLIDLCEKRAKQQVERLKDKLTDHEKEPLKVMTEEEDLESESSNTNDLQYEPIISKRITYSDNRPLHPQEAIKQMEALGNHSFMFKNIETNKYAMVFRRENLTYGLVEPENS